ncbi:hypothetical protein YTPLAS18_06440 [Nitrospira sp.]|nr:hypothetical protein YTPLAS18_06440 [Nitrospira sp.]
MVACLQGFSIRGKPTGRSLVTADPIQFDAREIALLGDPALFRLKAQVDAKLRRTLEAVHAELRDECRTTALQAPDEFDPDKMQLVKGEHLEHHPYQYLDYPKHFHGETTFTFRTLVWWGHHVVFAWLLEGGHLPLYKRRLLARYQDLVGQELEISLAPSLWEWKRGEGYTLPLLSDRRSHAAAVIERRSSLKVSRVVLTDDADIGAGRLPDLARAAFRGMLPIVARE